jgi:hypothetical protein
MLGSTRWWIKNSLKVSLEANSKGGFKKPEVAVAEKNLQKKIAGSLGAPVSVTPSGVVSSLTTKTYQLIDQGLSRISYLGDVKNSFSSPMA